MSGRVPIRHSLPRSVPWALQRGVLFGGFYNQFGWAFFGFGMIFVWVFLPHTDLTSWYYFRGETGTVSGKVEDTWRTGFSSGGARRRTTRGRAGSIYAHVYTFRTSPDTPLREGVSYASRRQLPAGSVVKVQYVVGREEISRIAGMRRTALPALASIFMIFPLAGLIFLAVGLRNGLRQRRLLANGKISTGRKISKRGTDTRINSRRVYELIFEFKDDLGKPHQTSVRTHRPRAIEDDAEELLLYDAQRPARAVLLDALPCRAVLTDAGQLECTSGNYLVLVIPALVIVGNLAAAYFLLR